MTSTHVNSDLAAAPVGQAQLGERKKLRMPGADANALVNRARQLMDGGNYLEAIDLYEQAHDEFPHFATEILAELYEIYKIIPQDRHSSYQARHFDFGIKPADKVLDIGSGHLPLPMATHLAEYAISDNSYGRAGAPFKYVDGKPVTECSVEDMPFRDKEFDFVYCSHVLEHVGSPEAACHELMRVAHAGYIETPIRAKDLFLNTGKISNHRWAVEYYHNKLVFTEYTPQDLDGLQNDLLLNMHIDPQTQREKAFSALVMLKSDRVNVMCLWKGAFSFEVRRLDGSVYIHNSEKPKGKLSESALKETKIIEPASSVRPTIELRPTCLFLNTYYPGFLDNHYAKNPQLAMAPYSEQLAAIQAQSFGDSDFYSLGLNKAGWRAQDLIINCGPMQNAWAREHGVNADGSTLLVEQVKRLQPDVVYCQDVHFMPRDVLQAIRPHVRIIAVQNASPLRDMPFDCYDVMFTSYPYFAKYCLERGLNAHCIPLAFDPRALDGIAKLTYAARGVPCSFVGGLSTIHRDRYELFEKIARETPLECWGYGKNTLEAGSILQSRHHGEVWGKEMFRVLSNSKVTINKEAPRTYGNEHCDSYTTNMRLFEATGCGALLITEYKDNLSEYFEIGKEVVAYRSVEECIALTRYYLANPDKAEVIAMAGTERTMRDHSYDKRMKQVSAILEKLL